MLLFLVINGERVVCQISLLVAWYLHYLHGELPSKPRWEWFPVDFAGTPIAIAVSQSAHRVYEPTVTAAALRILAGRKVAVATLGKNRESSKGASDRWGGVRATVFEVCSCIALTACLECGSVRGLASTMHTRYTKTRDMGSTVF